VKLVHLVGFIRKKFVTMHGHMNVKKTCAYSCHCARSHFLARCNMNVICVLIALMISLLVSVSYFVKGDF